MHSKSNLSLESRSKLQLKTSAVMTYTNSNPKKKRKIDNQHTRLSILLFTDFHFYQANRAQMNFIVS